MYSITKDRKKDVLSVGRITRINFKRAHRKYESNKIFKKIIKNSLSIDFG